VVYSTEGAPCARSSLPSAVELALILSKLRGLGDETTEYEHGGARTRLPERRTRTRERKNTHAGAKEQRRGRKRTRARERKSTGAGAKGHTRGSERTHARERKGTHAGAKGHTRGSERARTRERKNTRAVAKGHGRDTCGTHVNMGASVGGPE